ncbi:hypothetical protein PS687_00253 [Pseudomonas fluorescens]|nr:hypothetical protein PS687_00253 [Pseudomonas fluorescens]
MITSNSTHSPRPIPLNPTAVNPTPATPPIDQPHLIRPERNTEAPATPATGSRGGADSALAVLFAGELRQGIKDGSFPLFVDNIPTASTFGEWWSHLHDVMKSPRVIQWVSQMKVDRSKPIEIDPLANTIAATIGGKRQVLWGPQQGEAWNGTMAPIMAAARVIGAGKFPVFAPTSNTSAPYITVANFYGAPSSAQQNPAIEAQATYLETNKAFPPISLNDPHRKVADRSSDALQTETQKLGDTYDRYTLANKLIRVIVNHKELEKNLKYRSSASTYGKHNVQPKFAEEKLKRAILNALKSTHMKVKEGSSYSDAHNLKPGQTVSLEKFISDHGWETPKTFDEIANMGQMLLNNGLTAPPHADLTGAMSWPIPLGGISHDSLHTALTDNSLGLPGLQRKIHERGVLGYLATPHSFSAHQLGNPRGVIETILSSPEAQSLGSALQSTFQSVSTPSSINDWTLAALHATLDPESSSDSNRTKVAGFDLMQSKYWGMHPSKVVKGLADHLITQKRASIEMAPIAACLLLSHKAPELLVKGIPERVTYGSHSWVTFSTAVARVEADLPGSSATMTYADIMRRANVAPVNAGGRQIEYAAQHNALKDWGVVNGIIPSATDDAYTEEQMGAVRTVFNEQMKELSAASQAQTMPFPTRKEMALKELRRVYGEDIGFEEKCITSYPEHRDYPGPYSILDLYLNESISKPPVLDWVSSNSNVDVRQIQGQADRLENINAAFTAALPTYFDNTEKSIATQVKHIIATQPVGIRKDFEFGKITLIQENTIDYEPFSQIASVRAPANNNLLVNIERENQLRTYEVDLKSGQITERPELRDVQAGKFPANSTHPNLLRSEVIPSGQYPSDVADERISPPDRFSNFSSQRTAYIADAFVKVTNIRAFEAEARGTTTFDEEEPFYEKAREFLLNLIPFRSAIVNFQKGNIGEGVADLSMDIFGFLIGLGAAAKGTRLLSSATSTFSKALQGAKILGRAAIGSLNPLSGLDDLARSGWQGLKSARNGARKVYAGLTKVDMVSLAKRPGIVEGTIKSVNHVDDIKIVAKMDDATGHWHALDPRSGTPSGRPLDDFQPKVLSTDELKDNVESLYKRLDPKRELDICYGTALRTAQADKKITDKAFNTIIKETLNGGTPRYNTLMNIQPDTLKDTFNAADITESGVITFVSKKGYNKDKITHAVYIKKTPEGDLYLYHSNSHELDNQLGGLTTTPQTAGKANVYKLGSEQHAGIQRFMESGPGYSVVFTPASGINAQALA